VSLKLFRNTRVWIVFGSVVVALLWAGLAQIGVLRPLQQMMTEARYRARGPLPSPLKLIYVDIDTDATLHLGNFPYDRGIFAKVCKVLIEQGKAKAIGIDVVFSEAGVPNIADRKLIERGHKEFGRFLFAGPPVVLAATYAGGFKIAANGKVKARRFPLLNGAPGNGDAPELPEWPVGPMIFTPPNIGLIDIVGGLTQQVRLLAPSPGRTYYHMSVELARLYWGLQTKDIRVLDDHIELSRQDGTVLSQVPFGKGQATGINWFSPWMDPSNPRISIYDLYNIARLSESDDAAQRAKAAEFFKANDFTDAIVLIGPVDPLMQDLAPTAMDEDPVPKVGVHGNMLKTIVSGRYLRVPPSWAEWLVCVALTGLVVPMIVAPGNRGVWLRLAGGVLLLGYFGCCFWAFSKFDWILPMAAPLGATSTAILGGLVAQLVIEQQQKRRIKSMFGTYLAPSVVAQMVDSGKEPQLGGVEEEITAYFSDIQSFSSFSEVLPPARLVELMNEYLTACTDIVQAEGGTLDKYIGDAVVAMYGAPLALPTHAHKACFSALRVQRRVTELRTKWSHEAEKNWPEIVLRLQTRIGLNSGRAVVGNMGSTTRFSYTMMGDTVNLAARMESGAKFFGVYTMCTEATRAGCESAEPGAVVFRPLGSIVVKGRSTPVPIFELVGLADDVSAGTREAIALFAEGLECYHTRRWDEALVKFAESAKQEPNQPGVTPGVMTNPSLVYQKLVGQLRAKPPGPEWNGAYTMLEK
jgi:adenylate cyclase